MNNPLRFPGQYHDLETGLNHNWNRDYNPNLGRYIQSDPIGLEGGVNVYGYANASPIILIDPNGESAFCYFKWIFIGGLGGAATGCAFGAAAGAGAGFVAAGVGAIPGGAIGCGAGAAKGIAPGLALGVVVATQVCRGECEDDPGCDEHYTRCLHTSLADAVGGSWRTSRCSLCRESCVQNKGFWPSISHTGDRCDYWNFNRSGNEF